MPVWRVIQLAALNKCLARALRAAQSSLGKVFHKIVPSSSNARRPWQQIWEAETLSEGGKWTGCFSVSQRVFHSLTSYLSTSASLPNSPVFLHRTSATPILIYLIALLLNGYLHTAGPPVASDVPNVKAFPFQTIKDVLWAPPPKCVIFYLLKDGKNRMWKSPDCCLAACSWQQRNGEVLITTFCLSTSLRILFARDRNFLMTRMPVHPLRKDRITRRHKAECTVSKVPCGVRCDPLLDTAQENNWETFFMELLCAFDAHKWVRQQPTGGVHILPGLKVQCVKSFVA